MNNNKSVQATGLLGLIISVASSIIITVIILVIVLFSHSDLLDLALLCIIAIVWYACILQIKKYRRANTINEPQAPYTAKENGPKQVDPGETIIEYVSSIKHEGWDLGNSKLDGLQVDHHSENALILTNRGIWLIKVDQPSTEFIIGGKENTSGGMQFADNDKLNEMIATMTLQDILNDSLTKIEIPFDNIKSIKTSDSMRSISITDRDNTKNIYLVLQYQEYEKAKWIAEEWKKEHVGGNAFL